MFPTSHRCSCGTLDPRACMVYDGALGYSAIICTECGTSRDHEGLNDPSPYTLQMPIPPPAKQTVSHDQQELAVRLCYNILNTFKNGSSISVANTTFEGEKPDNNTSRIRHVYSSLVKSTTMSDNCVDNAFAYLDTLRAPLQINVSACLDTVYDITHAEYECVNRYLLYISCHTSVSKYIGQHQYDFHRIIRNYINFIIARNTIIQRGENTVFSKLINRYLEQKNWTYCARGCLDHLFVYDAVQIHRQQCLSGCKIHLHKAYLYTMFTTPDGTYNPSEDYHHTVCL